MSDSLIEAGKDRIYPKTGFFEEAPGVKSSTRLVVATVTGTGLLSVLGICGAGLYAFLKHHGVMADLVTLAQSLGITFTATVLPAAGLKIGQKLAEKPETNP